MRLAALLGLAVALGQAPTPSEDPQPQASPPVFATGVELVALDVSVVDAQGRPIRDLRADEFDVRVKGKPRRVVSAEFVEQTGAAPEQAAPPVPTHFSTNEGLVQGRLILIAVDEGNIRFGSGRDVVRAADQLLDRLGPADRVGLLAVPGPHPREDFTTDHDKIRTALRKVVGRGRFAGRRLTLTEALAFGERQDSFYWEQALQRECRSGDFLCERELEGEAFQVWSEFQNQSRRSIQTLRAALDVLKGVEGRKVLVLVSQGLGLPGTGPRLSVPTEIRDLGAAARAAQVSLYGVQVAHDIFPEMNSNLRASQMIDDQRLLDQGLDMLADFSGGEILRGTPELAYQRIAREISGYYLLGFEPEEGDRDGKEHDVRVKVTRPDLTVRARPQVLIPEAGRQPDPKAIVQAALGAAMTSAALPVRAGTWALRDMADGKVRLIVEAEVGRDEAPFELTIGFALFDEKGKGVASAVQPLSPPAEGEAGPARLEKVLVVDPGAYTLRVAARDGRGRQGSVDHPVAAALLPAGTFETSDLLLGAPPAAGSSFRPALDPAVAAGGTLATHMELYAVDSQALDELAVWLDVIDAGSAGTVRTVRARVSPARQPGRRLAQALIPVVGLAPGDYVARATVVRGTDELTSVARPFRILAK